MRILHLADLHLGKILHDLHLTADQAHILDQIVAIAVAERVEVVAICGDLYDRSVPPVQATVVMDDFLSRLLLEHGIPVIITPGNHDSAERLAFASRLLRARGLHITAGIAAGVQPVLLHDATGPVTFWPLPFIEPLALRRQLDDLEIDDYDTALQRTIDALPLAAGRNVCLAHCFTGGGEGSESERPLAIGGSSFVDPSRFARFDLTLLGHLHRAQRIGERIFYAGSPLQYAFSEAGQRKVATIFELAADGTFSRETLELVPLRKLRMVQGGLAQLLAAAESDPGREDYLWIELTDRGALFDYAAKLRSVYPNVLNITRSAYEQDGAGEGTITVRNRSEEEIVAAFFAHVTGEGLNPAEEAVLRGILDELLCKPDGGEACAR